MPIPFLYVAIVATPIFLKAAWSDYKTKLLDTRPLYFLMGLLYGGFFANGVSIWLAIAVTAGLLVVQWTNNRAKLKPIGSGDFPLLQAFGLVLMLFSPADTRIAVFFTFFIALLIFLGVYRWYFKDAAFAPAVAFSFLLLGLAKLLYI